MIRFILQSEKPLLTQRLKRVIFEGIPQGKPVAEAGHARVGVTVRQNLPVILHPAGLAPNRTPWTDLRWSLQDGQLTVSNQTPYVVRLAQELQMLPSGDRAMLPRTYLLPGDRISVSVPARTATQVRFQPATVYGFAVPPYDAPIPP
ncbi:putative fimbrial chaperone protein [compost metagenome]